MIPKLGRFFVYLIDGFKLMGITSQALENGQCFLVQKYSGTKGVTVVRQNTRYGLAHTANFALSFKVNLIGITGTKGRQPVHTW